MPLKHKNYLKFHLRARLVNLKRIKMKNLSSLLLVIGIMASMTISCNSGKKTDDKKEVVEKEDVLKSQFSTLTGEFIHVDTAAVLKVNNKLYGVRIDDMAKTVIKEAENIKTDDYDVINVVVKAEINPNTEPEGWEEVVTIKTLDKIYKPQPIEKTKVLKYSSNKTE